MNRKNLIFWRAGLGAAAAVVGISVLALTVGKSPPKAVANSPFASGKDPSSSPDTSDSFASSESEVGELPATSQDIQELLQDPDWPPSMVRAAMEYVKNPRPAETTSDPAAEYFNNVIAILLAQPREVVGLSLALLSVVKNESQPLLLRDYAMQHLWHAWSREINPGLKREIEECLKSNFENSRSPLQGVALLTTCRFFDQAIVVKGPDGETLTPVGYSAIPAPEFVSKPSAFTSQAFVDAALRVTGDPAVAANARTSAFNVLLRLEANQAVYSARQVLQDAGTPDEVRCSAIAALGAFGSPSTDQNFLKAIPVKPELVRAAADFALRRLLKSRPVH
jgi:hypothetical protein